MRFKPLKPAEHHHPTLGGKEVQLRNHLHKLPQGTSGRQSIASRLEFTKFHPEAPESRWAISPPRKMALAPNSQSLASKWSPEPKLSNTLVWSGEGSSKWEPRHPFTRELRRLQTSVSQALCVRGLIPNTRYQCNPCTKHKRPNSLDKSKTPTLKTTKNRNTLHQASAFRKTGPAAPPQTWPWSIDPTHAHSYNCRQPTVLSRTRPSPSFLHLPCSTMTMMIQSKQATPTGVQRAEVGAAAFPAALCAGSHPAEISPESGSL